MQHCVGSQRTAKNFGFRAPILDEMVLVRRKTTGRLSHLNRDNKIIQKNIELSIPKSVFILFERIKRSLYTFCLQSLVRGSSNERFWPSIVLDHISHIHLSTFGLFFLDRRGTSFLPIDNNNRIICDIEINIINWNRKSEPRENTSMES